MSLAIALAIPFFFAAIAVEAAIVRRRGGTRYRFADAISCISCGIGQQVTGLLWKATLLAIYVAVYDRAALASWSASSPLTWIVAILLVDHQYYAWHRTAHRCRLLWATHVVHHQSEDYNLAVALRQTWFSAFTSLPFQLPLAVIGIPPIVFATCTVVDTLYQFWIHTELVDDLGPLEAVLNTPSHHRVHHGVDPAHIDRNHAGILIVWDRLYGTFVPETKRPTYGTVTPLGSGDPLWANAEPWVAMARDLRAIRSPVDKLRYLFGPPEWRPTELGGPITIPEPTPGRITWDPRPSSAARAYVVGWFAAVSIVVTTALGVEDTLGWTARALLAVGVLATTWTWAALLEGKPWAAAAERARLAACALIVVGAAAAGAMLPAWAGVVIAGLAVSAVAVGRTSTSSQALPAIG